MKPLPCPFCGSDVVTHPNDIAGVGSQNGVPHVDSFYVHCDGCGADGPIERTHQDAITLWNNRGKPNGRNYRWKRCYELADGVRHWAIVDDESSATGRVVDFLLVVNHHWSETFGIEFPKHELPSLIIDLLNGVPLEQTSMLQTNTLLRDKINSLRHTLEEIVCTKGEDKGVVLKDHNSHTHAEVVNGETVFVYDNEYFSELGEALIKLHEQCEIPTDDEVKDESDS